MSPSGKKLSDEGRKRLRTLCAEYYYKRNLSQSEIAQRLRIDASSVSRLIKEARETRIVQIEIVESVEEQLPLTLIHEFNLKDAHVIPSPAREGDGNLPFPSSQLNMILGRGAAEYLERMDSPLEDGLRIGLSCGATLLEMIIAFNRDRFRNLDISPLTVEGLPQYTHEAPSTLVGLMCSKFPKGSKAFAPLVMPHLPMDQESEDSDCLRAKIELLAQKAEELYGWQIRKLIQRAKALQLAIVGIGTLNPKAKNRAFSEILRRCHVNMADVQKLGIVGEIANRPYDMEGNDRTDDLGLLGKGSLSIPLQILKDLAKRKPVIAVAGGREKVQAIYTALSTGMVNTLVTDSRTAQALLVMAKSKDL